MERDIFPAIAEFPRREIIQSLTLRKQKYIDRLKIRKMENEPIVMERLFNAPVEQVWKAITDKDEMKQWYFDIEAFEPVVGFEFQFEGGNDVNRYLHLCKITEVIKNKKLAYSWRYDGFDGDSLVTFELFPEGSKTRLKLTHEGLETFATSHPDLSKENAIEGWNYLIGSSLGDLLEKKDVRGK